MYWDLSSKKGYHARGQSHYRKTFVSQCWFEYMVCKSFDLMRTLCCMCVCFWHIEISYQTPLVSVISLLLLHGTGRRRWTSLSFRSERPGLMTFSALGPHKLSLCRRVRKKLRCRMLGSDAGKWFFRVKELLSMWKPNWRPDDARDTSPLNTPLPAKDEDQPGSPSMYTTDAVESEGEFTSYQPPKQSSTKQQTNKGERKRKAETENLYAVQTKIKRTEDSIKKLEKHIEDKTCPKSLRYSARANIPPDEEFKKDIQAVKQKAERGFLSALTRFNNRRLEKQKIKLRKLKGKSLLTLQRATNYILQKRQISQRYARKSETIERKHTNMVHMSPLF